MWTSRQAAQFKLLWRSDTGLLWRFTASSTSPPSARGCAKEMAKCDADIARVDARNSAMPISSSARPEEIVEDEREKREEAETRKAKIAEALERLKGAA